MNTTLIEPSPSFLKSGRQPANDQRARILGIQSCVDEELLPGVLPRVPVREAVARAPALPRKPSPVAASRTFWWRAIRSRSMEVAKAVRDEAPLGGTSSRGACVNAGAASGRSE